jgi:hypothetical protein
VRRVLEQAKKRAQLVSGVALQLTKPAMKAMPPR